MGLAAEGLAQLGDALGLLHRLDPALERRVVHVADQAAELRQHLCVAGEELDVVVEDVVPQSREVGLALIAGGLRRGGAPDACEGVQET